MLQVATGILQRHDVLAGMDSRDPLVFSYHLYTRMKSPKVEEPVMWHTLPSTSFYIFILSYTYIVHLCMYTYTQALMFTYIRNS